MSAGEAPVVCPYSVPASHGTPGLFAGFTTSFEVQTVHFGVTANFCGSLASESMPTNPFRELPLWGITGQTAG
jgi:hypothetical protein